MSSSLSGEMTTTKVTTKRTEKLFHVGGKRKVSSQFGEECLDGRKSFIFSWNKQHRVIHEQALRHQFDPNKKGQKFDYQRQFPNQESKPGPELRATLTELGIP